MHCVILLHYDRCMFSRNFIKRLRHQSYLNYNKTKLYAMKLTAPPGPCLKIKSVRAWNKIKKQSHSRRTIFFKNCWCLFDGHFYIKWHSYHFDIFLIVISISPYRKMSRRNVMFPTVPYGWYGSFKYSPTFQFRPL